MKNHWTAKFRKRGAFNTSWTKPFKKIKPVIIKLCEEGWHPYWSEEVSKVKKLESLIKNINEDTDKKPTNRCICICNGRVLVFSKAKEEKK